MIINTKLFKKIFSFCCFIIFFIYWGCADSGTDPQSINIVLPDSNITYNDHIYTLLDLKCGSRSGCHSRSDESRNFLLDYNEIISYTLLYAGTKLILEGKGSSDLI